MEKTVLLFNILTIMGTTLRETEKELAQLATTVEFEAATVESLPAAGSDRRYYRLTDKAGHTLIGVKGTDRRENEAFLALASYFRKKGCRVPEIKAVSSDKMMYLQTDLGTVSLLDILHTPGGDRAVEECLLSLAQMQTLPSAEWQRMTFNAPFSTRLVMWDLNYFKYMFLKQTSAVFDEERLEDCFEALARDLCAMPPDLTGFMYRDCQSRNVMICGGEPYWIDFQGGRVGPCLYDAVSFLWQARAAFTPEGRQRYLEVYASEFARLRDVDEAEILRNIPLFALFRTLQVLGAYGYRGLIQKKAHFVTSIPGALANLSELLADGVAAPYPELERVCRKIEADPRFAAWQSDGLTVEVFSFSYKKGYPEDLSGNGGGFMFDCRALHNPGRYDRYKPLTGLDKDVIDFLEERGEIQPFLAAAWQLTDPAVERYLQRGFTSLQIGFGCTGGRHRSVYSAEHTAAHIAAKFPAARVIVNHREHGIRHEVKQDK